MILWFSQILMFASQKQVAWRINIVSSTFIPQFMKEWLNKKKAPTVGTTNFGVG